MQSLLILFDSLLSFFIWILIINVVLSWLIGFNILNAQNKLVYLIYEFSYKFYQKIFAKFWINRHFASITNIFALFHKKFVV